MLPIVCTWLRTPCQTPPPRPSLSISEISPCGVSITIRPSPPHSPYCRRLSYWPLSGPSGGLTSMCTRGSLTPQLLVNNPHISTVGGGEGGAIRHPISGAVSYSTGSHGVCSIQLTAWFPQSSNIPCRVTVHSVIILSWSTLTSGHDSYFVMVRLKSCHGSSLIKVNLVTWHELDNLTWIRELQRELGNAQWVTYSEAGIFNVK